MRTLNKCYLDMLHDINQWSYYRNFPQIEDCLETDDKAYEFIKSYFYFAGKTVVFKDDFVEKNNASIKARSRHIVSTFLLGLEITKCFGIDIDIRNYLNMNFKYYWFLACLYHDVGYAYERADKVDFLEEVKNNGFEAIKEFCDVKYMPKTIFRTYNKEVVEFYMKCRSMPSIRNGKPVCGKIDHGIIGGVLLYDKLRKQFDKWWTKRINKENTKKSFYIKHNGEKLHLSNKHFKEYEKAADAIIAHNIWLGRLGEYIEKYHRNDIVVPQNRISIDNEISFILSLADSVEPIKKNVDLNSIKISPFTNKKGLELIIPMKDNKYEDEDFTSITDWLDVNVEINIDGENKRVCISLIE